MRTLSKIVVLLYFVASITPFHLWAFRYLYTVTGGDPDVILVFLLCAEMAVILFLGELCLNHPTCPPATSTIQIVDRRPRRRAAR